MLANLWVALVSLATAAVAYTAPLHHPGPHSTPVPNQYTVWFRKEIAKGKTSLDPLLEAHWARIGRHLGHRVTYKYFPGTQIGYFADLSDEELALVRSDPSVRKVLQNGKEYALHDPLGYTELPELPDSSAQLEERELQNRAPKHLVYASQKKRFPTALDGYHYPNRAGEGIRVYVFDTGVNLKADGLDVRGTPFEGPSTGDRNGHGTCMASLIAGQHFGVAKKATIVDVRVMDSRGFIDKELMLKKLKDVVHIESHGNRPNAIILASFVYKDNHEAYRNAWREATRANITIVAAAGNEHKEVDEYPARHSFTIAVGSCDFKYKYSWFSGYGERVNIVSTGEDISCANSNGGTRVGAGGTSAANAIVAGMTALYLSVFPHANPIEVSGNFINRYADRGIVNHTPRQTTNFFANNGFFKNAYG